MIEAATKRLRKLLPSDLADEASTLKARLDAITDEAIRRGLQTAEGQAGRIALSPPGIQNRSDRDVLLTVLGISMSETELVSCFCRPVKTDWRLTITPRRTFRAA
jgi:hypothetical protein